MEATAPNPFEEVLDVVRAVDVQGVKGAALRELLVAAEASRNAIEALQAQVMVAMRAEAHQADLLDPHTRDAVVFDGSREEFVVDEVAVELTCTRVAAGHRFATALAAADLPAVAAAWAAGVIDARKVQILTDGLTCCDPVFADTITTTAVSYATGHTGPQLRAWLTRRVITADPKAAEARRERATAGRRVTFTPLPDGVAELTALMPAAQARHLYDTLTAAAHALDGPGETRNLDQRRSDTLYDLLTARADPPQIHLQVTLGAGLLTGQSEEPAELAGYGPLTPSHTHELLGGTSEGRVWWQRLLTDPATGTLTDISDRYRPSTALDRAVRARDVTCRFPGCRRSALTARSGVDLDHTVPWPHGDTSAQNLACLCRHHHRLKHSPDWGAVLDPDGTMHWTTPTGRHLTTTPWHYTDPDPPGSPDP